MHHFDIIYITEKYLNSGISFDSEDLDIPGYILVRSDHHSNDKQGGVCVYLKSPLPIQILIISVFHECINLEITVNGKLCKLICLNILPSQNIEELEKFVKNLALNLEFIFNKNQYLTVVVGGFNAKHVTGIKAMRAHYGLAQIIKNKTHIRKFFIFYRSYFYTSAKHGCR